ncbi:hypothetical protein O181_088892 [Austropuccinia psidii MF-1]|uniref:Uncharacterized protein n=1 Tax=Austropuccinia psidii MF-1 TaxID=1389203 RepID=A0A9Q3ISE3_9BASI|nr:hypothetical protein [Austropuccinia psidii MF-1]
MQEPYHVANCSGPLQSNDGSFTEWVTCLNRVPCVAFNLEMSVDASPSLLNNCLPQENHAISHFIGASIPHYFALCIGIVPSSMTARDFFKAIKSRCCPGSHFQKMKVVQDLLEMLVENSSGNPKSNTSIVLSLQCTFAMFKKLNIEANKLQGLLAQVSCHAPQTLTQEAFDQLITAAMLWKGDKNPFLTFVGQVIINASQRQDDQAQMPSTFVYQVSELPDLTPYMLHNPRPSLCRVMSVDRQITLSKKLAPHASIVDVPAIGRLTAHIHGAWQIQTQVLHCQPPFSRQGLPPLIDAHNKLQVLTTSKKGHLRCILSSTGHLTQARPFTCL